MTIFDKLSGLASKAKETALSRAVLAKDKRLDKSISESLDDGKIGLSKMSTFGIPGRVSAVAYDPVAGLLAVAGGAEPDTYIRIFGKGISSALTLNSETRIKYLQFKTGSPILVAVDMKNIVTTYDLKTKRPQHVVATPSIVTSLEHCTGTDWLMVGFADGNVDMFDMEVGSFGEEYGIPNLCLDQYEEQQQQQKLQPPPHNIVVAIQMHPTDLDLVLVGYESAVFLWSIRDQTVKKKFTTLQRGNDEVRLTCLTWSPCGTRFMAGYDNGYMHLWDARQDHKPLLSRRVFQACPTGSPTNDNPCEPIFRMAWYVDDATRKSFLVVAGGSDLPDIRGLHVMEFDLDSNDPRDARKQTILPTTEDVSDFILLSSEPYYLGMHSPLGLLIVGCDGAIRAYGLDHGHPPLILPPALQFLDPPVEQAYYISQLPHPVFQRLIAPPPPPPQQQQQQAFDRYLPLTGGVAGSGHIYRIPSNDLLLTLHGKSTLRFWDASYTSLRPLSHRTIHCSDDIAQPQSQQKSTTAAASIQHVVLDNHTGAVLVAMDNGVILVYVSNSIEEKQPAGHSSVQEQFIANCDDTLDEISQLLRDMNNDNEDETVPPPPPAPEDNVQQQPGQGSSAQSSPAPPPQAQQSIAQTTAPTQETQQSVETKGQNQDQNNPFAPPAQSEEKPAAEETTPGLKITLLDKPNEKSGFTLAMLVTLEEDTVSKIVSGENSLFAFSTYSGRTYVLDGMLGKIVFATDLKGDNAAATVSGGSGAVNDSTSMSTEGSGSKTSVKLSQDTLTADTTISQIALYPSYSPFDLSSFQTTAQLYIGLSNGYTYQHDITVNSSQPLLIPSTSSYTAVVNIHMIDIHGSPARTEAPAAAPTAETESPLMTNDQQQQQLPNEQLPRKSEDSGKIAKDDAASIKSESSSKGNSGAAGLLRKTTRKFSKSANRNRSNSQSAPPLPPPLPNQQDQPPLPTSEEPSELMNSPTATGSKRVTAGRWEYHQQPSPHFLIIVSTRSIATFLSGYNTRLFHADLQSTQGCTEQDTIIHSQVMTADGGGTCLAVVLHVGSIIFYSLPHLTPLARVSLPADFVASRRLEDMSLSTDGRIMVWSGAFELEQYLVLLQTNLPYGESVMLHNPNIKILPHPVQAQVSQKPKKSWLDTVQGAFQKGPLTVTEFDTIMGKMPKAEPMRKSAGAKTAQSSSSSGSGSGSGSAGKAQKETSGVGGVFQELGMKMNERGERLNQLETKFEDMNQASGDFLKAVRDYNERQARKKWWEL